MMVSIFVFLAWDTSILLTTNVPISMDMQFEGYADLLLCSFFPLVAPVNFLLLFYFTLHNLTEHAVCLLTMQKIHQY